MKISKKLQFMIVASLLLLAITGPVLAQSNYTSLGRTVSSAKTIGSGDYLLSGSVGQPEAGEALSGGDFTLTGGLAFEGSMIDVDETFIYLPTILRN